MSMVSVVIPTIGRPKLLQRAVRSVLDQSYRDIEVIVVIDGQDPETRMTMARTLDPRLRILVNHELKGAAAARNIGACACQGTWLALLDDDDEWMPSKIERQLEFLDGSTPTLVTCLTKVVTPNGTHCWPYEIYANNQQIADYLFDRRSINAGNAFIQTSSYLIEKKHYMQIGFRGGECTPHDDWDFLIRFCRLPDSRIVTVPEALVTYYYEEARPTLGRKNTWKSSLDWADRLDESISPTAYSGFCLVVAGSRAAEDRDHKAFFILLSWALSGGSPRAIQVLLYLGFWIVPTRIRRRLRTLLARLAAPTPDRRW